MTANQRLLDRPFPSLSLTADGMRSQGSFAQTQQDYLDPDPGAVAQLQQSLEKLQAGVVAHFYMEPELQGVLYGVKWPHIHISDSLKMADAAVEMVRDGAKVIVVLGVDFMAENVRAVLDNAGLDEVPVYRVTQAPIGCSLAESAESTNYQAYLQKASKSSRPLHVVYINTSLRSKAHAQSMLPTITCTSSNVVRTVMQAFSQDPKLNLWFGPDTYMGANLKVYFESLRDLGDDAIASVHPNHNVDSVTALLERYHYFGQGTCIVHHMFGQDVVERLQRDYEHAHITAHLEVPGEMFSLGLQAQQAKHGRVGSTSDILGYILSQVQKSTGTKEKLSFVLGTEAGMITSIAQSVRAELAKPGNEQLEVEIIFPVSDLALTSTSSDELPVVPGVASGEGCSTSGGCATCPYMKMNSLDALHDLCSNIEATTTFEQMAAYEPRRLPRHADGAGGKSLADLGTEPILEMRTFQTSGKLSSSLFERIRTLS